MIAKELARATLYGGLDLMTAGRGVSRVICGERIRLPARWCRWYPAGYEPHTFGFLRAHCGQGQTALDIGAHLGLFSIVMARRVGPQGKVYSFEPTASTRGILKEPVPL